MQIKLAPRFFRERKKLPPDQKAMLDEAIEVVTNDPFIGDALIGNFARFRVYKLKTKSQYRLAYTYHEQTDTLTLVKFSSRQNFYRDLSRHLKSIT